MVNRKSFSGNTDWPLDTMVMGRKLLSEFNHLLMARGLMSKISKIEASAESLADAGPGEFGTYRATPEQVLVALQASQIPEYAFAASTYVRLGFITPEGDVVWDVVFSDGKPLFRLTASPRPCAGGTRVGFDVVPCCGPRWSAVRRALREHPGIGVTCRQLVRDHVEAALTSCDLDGSKFGDLLAGKCP